MISNWLQILTFFAALFFVKSSLAMDICFELFQKSPLTTKSISLEDISNLKLSTERLEIRSIGPNELDAVEKILTNPKNIEMSKDDLDRETISMLLEMGQSTLRSALDSTNLYITFGIYLQDKLVGVSMLGAGDEDSIFNTGVGKPNEKWASLSYHLDPSVWGKGFATELSGRIIKFVFENLHLNGLHGAAIASNTTSIRVLEKLGFKSIDYLDDPEYKHFYLKPKTHIEGKK